MYLPQEIRGRLGERAAAATFGWPRWKSAYEAQDENRHEFENKEKEESNGNISGNETRQYPINFVIVRGF